LQIHKYVTIWNAKVFLRMYRNIENVTLASRKIHLTKTIPVPEVVKTKSRTRRRLTRVSNPFQNDESSLSKSSASRSSTAAASLASRKFLWQARRKYRPTLREKSATETFRQCFPIWRMVSVMHRPRMFYFRIKLILYSLQLPPSPFSLSDLYLCFHYACRTSIIIL